MKKKIKASILAGEFQICKLPAGSSVPQDIWDASFCTVSKTEDEVSIVMPVSEALPNAQANTGWRGIKLIGPLDFKLTGVIASLVTPLAKSGISVFTISTYETDYLFVKSEDFKMAISVLSNILKLVGFKS